MKNVGSAIRAAELLVGHAPPTCGALQARLHRIADSYPELCQITQVGRSRSGAVMEMLCVKGGDHDVLIVGGPQPNEPIGFASILALAQYVTTNAEMQAEHSWHFFACSDPDGARLNEPWTTSWPPTMESYHRYFYRPARWHQPEWTFPASSFTGQLPETKALMAVIDEVRPELYVSLHNSDSGGAFLMSSHAETYLPNILQSAASSHRLPVEEAPLDCAGWASPGTGAFVLPAVAKETLESSASGPVCGSSSAHYAGQYGLALFLEVPMWHTRGITLPAGVGAEVLESAATTLDDVLQRSGPYAQDSVFLPAALDILTVLRLNADVLRQNAGAGTNQDRALLAPLRAAGMMLRHLESQPDHAPDLTAELTRTEKEFRAWCSRAEDTLHPVPIPLHDSAGFQIEVILRAAAALTGSPFLASR
ncbi:M14 family zinc carboxypeptidase [Streptomyces sp. NPDC051133]|uniref:M14 family zinc carboxypeptidase n=1 Tax=Streptomyces sp. NPDC051133 TaxID=3155521 RepID=UPI003426E346